MNDGTTALITTSGTISRSQLLAFALLRSTVMVLFQSQQKTEKLQPCVHLTFEIKLVLIFQFTLFMKAQERITLSVTNVQVPQTGRPDFLLSPVDTWSKSVSQLGPYTVQGQGEAGDFQLLTIHLEDEDANLDDPSSPRYARAGLLRR